MQWMRCPDNYVVAHRWSARSLVGAGIFSPCGVCDEELHAFRIDPTPTKGPSPFNKHKLCRDPVVGRALVEAFLRRLVKRLTFAVPV